MKKNSAEDFYFYMIDCLNKQINKAGNSKIIDEMMRHIRTLIEDFYKDYRKKNG